MCYLRKAVEFQIEHPVDVLNELVNVVKHLYAIPTEMANGENMRIKLAALVTDMKHYYYEYF